MSLNQLLEEIRNDSKFKSASGGFDVFYFGRRVMELLEGDETYQFIVIPNLSTEKQNTLQRKANEGMEVPTNKDEERKRLVEVYRDYFDEPAVGLLEGDNTSGAGKQNSVPEDLIERVKAYQKKDEERRQLVDANHPNFCEYLNSLDIQTKKEPPKWGMYFLTLNRQQVDALNKSPLVDKIFVDYPTNLMHLFKNQK